MASFKISRDELDAVPTLSTSQLAGLYNNIATTIGEKVVNRFSDKATALKRTQALLARVELEIEEIGAPAEEAQEAGPTEADYVAAKEAEEAEEAEEAAEEAKAEEERAEFEAEAAAETGLAPTPETASEERAARRTRIMRFNFKPMKDGIKTIREKPNSLRGRVIELLRRPTGGTFQEVVDAVHAFDKARGSTPGHQERRAYEIVRICHYYLGWGIAHNIETGAIRLYSKEEQA